MGSRTRAAGTFSLLDQRKGTKRKDTPGVRRFAVLCALPSFGASQTAHPCAAAKARHPGFARFAASFLHSAPASLGNWADHPWPARSMLRISPSLSPVLGGIQGVTRRTALLAAVFGARYGWKTKIADVELLYCLSSCSAVSSTYLVFIVEALE